MVATFGTDTMWVGWPWSFVTLCNEDCKTSLLKVATTERTVTTIENIFALNDALPYIVPLAVGLPIPDEARAGLV